MTTTIATFDPQRVLDGTFEARFWASRLLREPANATAKAHFQAAVRSALAELFTGVPIEAIEATMIQATVEKVGGNVSAAAAALGLSRSTIHKRKRTAKTPKTPPKEEP